VAHQMADTKKFGELRGGFGLLRYSRTTQRGFPVLLVAKRSRGDNYPGILTAGFIPGCSRPREKQSARWRLEDNVLAGRCALAALRFMTSAKKGRTFASTLNCVGHKNKEKTK